MSKNDSHRIGRLASVAGLGLSLAFGVAPVAALATPSGAAVSMAGEESTAEHAVNIAPMEGGTLTPDKSAAREGDFVRLYIKPDKGMHFVSGTISVVDAGGNPVETGADENGYFYFTMPDSAVTAKVDFAPYDQPEEPGDPDEPENPDEPEQPTLNFPDVQEGAWYYGGVQWAVETGLMAGNADGTFTPTASLSRAQLAVLLWNFADNPEPSDSQAASGFTDTDPNGFYSGALAWCVENGYLMGLDAERFAPSDAITREQLAVVFWRAAGSPESDRDLSKYPDAGTVSEFAGTAMRWAVEKGILSGQGGGTLDPQGKVDRAQAAVIFQRIAG